MTQLAEILVTMVLTLISTNCETCQTGWASRYDPGVMEATIEVRQEFGHLPQDLSRYDGAIAVLDCEHVGRDAFLFLEGEWHDVIVADCAVRDDSDGTISWMESNNIIVELSWPLAESVGYTTIGAKRVTLAWEDPYE